MAMAVQQTVFVGLSGGVDSAVAAARLVRAGHTVVGVFIKVWHPDFLVCNWEEERLDAMRVAAHLGIPFLTCDAEARYRDDVAHYFIEEYRAGRTPNPDVMCNQHVKFGAFLEFALERGADYIATGHYAQRVDTEEGATLMRGNDPDKDQSYFLWSLEKDTLAKVLFPVGDTPKARIRAEAEQHKLPVFDKKDSQGICFLGHVDIKDFLSHYISLTPGAVLDTEGTVIGTHEGALVYTAGQRHGFTIHSSGSTTVPHYVTKRDITHNTITVAPERPQISPASTLTLTHLVLREPLHRDDVVVAQTRYRQAPFAVTITAYEHNTLTLRTHNTVEAVASGQSCVLYRGNTCIGGGIIA